MTQNKDLKILLNLILILEVMRITICDYLITGRCYNWIYRVKGIDAERISGKGMEKGKSKLRDDCTEEEHALNRRSEFMITKSLLNK
jgi:hypothetical protein